jgi:hypothetical protein
MEASKNYDDEPAGKDLGALLFLVAACPLGLLGWVALFSAVRWSVLAIWGAAAGVLPHAAIMATSPAIAAQAPVPVPASRPDPASSPLWILPHGLHFGTPASTTFAARVSRPQRSF